MNRERKGLCPHGYALGREDCPSCYAAFGERLAHDLRAAAPRTHRFNGAIVAPELVAILRAILPYVAIDHHDDETDTWHCMAAPPCLQAIRGPMPDWIRSDEEVLAYLAARDKLFEHGFPHTPECPARRALEAAQAAVKE